MLQHAKQVTMDTEIAGGAYWHPEYDPLDPMTFEDAHSAPPTAVQALVDEKKAFPVLVSQASIYPGGRIMPAIMKGILPGQNIVNMPTDALSGHEDIAIPVLIGKGMASDTKLVVGDAFTIRWLDTDRTYDADEGLGVLKMREGVSAQTAPELAPLSSIKNLSFDDLQKNRDEYLGLRKLEL